jgi:hypothetical protein
MLYICLLAKKVSLGKKMWVTKSHAGIWFLRLYPLSPFSFAVSLGEREQARRPPHMAGPLPLRNPMTPPSAVICDLTKKF